MKILIAEDNRDTRKLLCFVFEVLKKFEVLEAKDGEEAVMMARDHQPDLVLMDVLMPKMGGFAALEQMKANGLSVPVVLMSCIFTPKQKRRGMELGATDFLQKPFEVATLEKKVEQWAEGG